MSDEYLRDLLRVGQVLGHAIGINPERLRAYLDSPDCPLDIDYQRHCKLVLDLRAQILGDAEKDGKASKS